MYTVIYTYTHTHTHTHTHIYIFIYLFCHTFIDVVFLRQPDALF